MATPAVVIHFGPRARQPPPGYGGCVGLGRRLMTAAAPVDRLEALLQLTDRFHGAGELWWWVLRELGAPLAYAARWVGTTYPMFTRVRIAACELELCRAWLRDDRSPWPRRSLFGGPVPGLIAALGALQLDRANAETLVQVLQYRVFNKEPGTQQRWLDFLARRFEAFDHRRVQSLSDGAARLRTALRTGAEPPPSADTRHYLAEVLLHAERLRALALEFAGLAVPPVHGRSGRRRVMALRPIIAPPLKPRPHVAAVAAGAR